MLNLIDDFKADPTFTNDSTGNIQTALRAASASGAAIYAPPGRYKYTSLQIPAGGVSLIGAGAGATIFQTAPGSEGVISLTVGDGVNTCADVRITDIQFTSTNQKTANAGIKLQKCFRVWIERVRLQNQFRGLHIFNSTETWINDCDIRDTSENGVVFEATVGNGFDCYISNLTADNPTILSNNAGSGVLWLGGENFVIHNCDVLHFQTGFGAIPPTGQQCRFGFFSAAEFDTCYDNGIKLTNQSGGDVVGLTFTNGWSGTATNYGTLIDGGGTGLLQGTRFVGHKSFHNGLAGFRLAAGLDIHLLGCDVVGNSQTSSGTRHGIEVASGMANGSFSIIGCRSTNGYQQGSTQGNGVNFDAATYTHGLILHNDLAGNANQGLVTNGATGMIIRGNNGHNPKGNVTAPGVPATTTPLTNTTGYDCMVLVTGGTVTQIAIGGTNTGQTSGWFRVPANQTITLTYSAAPTWTWFGD